ncbi:MAG: phosphoribosylformylglycinamidine synthase subunit PurS [Verrucomicrobiota bacterium]|nr:phosphoribosylformylglycinamidine synthase subunit PurS [Verrucomicrobiota bacterium]
MKARVVVLPKQSILDPQGLAVRDAMQHYGVPNVQAVRVGKLIEIELSGPATETELHAVCRDLLSNSVVEEYQLILEE